MIIDNYSVRSYFDIIDKRDPINSRMYNPLLAVGLPSITNTINSHRTNARYMRHNTGSYHNARNRFKKHISESEIVVPSTWIMLSAHELTGSEMERHGDNQ